MSPAGLVASLSEDLFCKNDVLLSVLFSRPADRTNSVNWHSTNMCFTYTIVGSVRHEGLKLAWRRRVL